MNFLQRIRHPFRYAYYNATLIIIAINTGFFLFFNLFPQLKVYLCLNVVYVFKYHFFWQPFTYMFIHENFTHLLCNMLGLFFFGIATERAIGSKEFTLMYLLCGTLSGIISLFIYYFTGMYMVFLLGASGAVYSMLLAYAVLFPRSRIFIWGIIPLPAPVLVILYALIEAGSQFLGGANGVAHLTHLAGFAVAWIYFQVRMGINPLRVWKDAYR